MQKFKTFAFTLRPRDGVTDKQIQKLNKYIRNKCEYWHVITEKTDDERHVHAALVMKEPTTRSNISTYLSRMYKDLEDDEHKVMLSGLKIMYNEDFIRKYMDKDDDTVVVDSNLPEEGFLESYFPPKPKEEGVKAKRQLAYHQYMKELEALWREHQPVHVEVNTENVRDFLFNMQYNKRLIGLIDDKKLIQVSKWLTRWMNKVEWCHTGFLPPFEHEEGAGHHV